MPWGSPVSLDDYGTALRRGGTAVLPGVPGTIWTRYETAAMVRMPTFNTAPVSQQDVRQLLRKGRAGLMSFILEPDEKYPLNA